MPLELFIYFLLPGGAGGSAWSVCEPLAGHQSRASLQCSSCGTPPQCPPCRQWGRRPRSILRSPRSLGKWTQEFSQGLRKTEKWQRGWGQAKKVKGTLSRIAHIRALHLHRQTRVSDRQTQRQMLWRGLMYKCNHHQRTIAWTSCQKWS